MEFHENFSLKNFNTFGIEAKARQFVAVHSITDLKTVLEQHPDEKKFILGGGSNMLLTKDIDALVIHVDLKGKKIIIVNTASKCGLTPQYKDLEAVYKEYKDKGLVIVGFPANNFASQEPGTNEEIATFCQLNYGVTFPMMDKVSVKGDDMAAIYQFLTQKSKNGLQDSTVEWNFQKYLINEKGELEKVIAPRTLVTDPEVLNWIKA